MKRQHCPHCTPDPEPLPPEAVPNVECVVGVCKDCAGAAMLDKDSMKLVALSREAVSQLLPHIQTFIAMMQHEIAAEKARRN